MKFEDLALAEPILRAVTAEGYTTPTPIQIKSIPHVLAGSDLLGCAQTGTGKTAAFALPILHRLANAQHKPASHAHGSEQKHDHHHKRGADRQSRPIRALILCPTRELAAQIGDSFRAYGRNLPLKHTVIFGGVNQFHQVRAIQHGVDVLIATPGRLLDLMNQGHVDVKHVEIFVLDEADRMLDMGFIPDIRRVVKQIPAKRQTLLFSATMPTDIRELAESILNKPESVHVNPVASTAELISQSVYYVARQGKPALLRHLIKNWQMGRTLVFTRTKHGADKVAKGLMLAGIKAEAIHGNKSQNHRTRTLKAFKSDAPPVLVATDIASRGIDVDDITHVINFDIPNVAETYVHRIGRTARAGASGVAVSFCDPGEERGDFRAIEKLIRKTIEVQSDAPELSRIPNTVVQTSEPRREHRAERPLSERGWSKKQHGEARGHSSHGPRKHAGEKRSQRDGQGATSQGDGWHKKSSDRRHPQPHDARHAHPSHAKKRDVAPNPQGSHESHDQGKPKKWKHAQGSKFTPKTKAGHSTHSHGHAGAHPQQGGAQQAQGGQPAKHGFQKRGRGKHGQPHAAQGQAHNHHHGAKRGKPHGGGERHSSHNHKAH